MQVLTPSGYQDPVALANGAEVCAFDAVTGAPIVNHIENIDVVDYAEWCRWWQVEEAVPAFNWYLVNDVFLLFGEQSIWRNGTDVCHAQHLVIGDEIYGDADQPIAITSIDVVEDNSLIWYRFHIDGDHSFIADGLTVHNASRFWIGGTGNLDGTTTTHISSTSGGTGGASYPTSADTLTFDASSGGGTVTVTADVNLSSITMGAFTGTLDFGTNNNNATLSTFNGSGSGARTLNMGNGTWTITSALGLAVWNMTAIGNLTFNANSSILVFSASGTATRTFTPGALTYSTVTIAANSSRGPFVINVGTSATFATLNITPGNYVMCAGGLTVTNPINWSGTSANPILFMSNSTGNAIGLTVANGSIMDWAAIRDINFLTGTITATNSLDLGHNSGITITPPSGGLGGVGVIGS